MLELECKQWRTIIDGWSVFKGGLTRLVFLEIRLCLNLVSPGFLCNTDWQIQCFLKCSKCPGPWDNKKKSLTKNTFTDFLKLLAFNTQKKIGFIIPCYIGSKEVIACWPRTSSPSCRPHIPPSLCLFAPPPKKNLHYLNIKFSLGIGDYICICSESLCLQTF